MDNKSNKKKIAIIVGLIAVLIIIGVSVFTLGSDGRALKKQLDLGYKFLTEQDYEQAIATFKKAIEIDPMSVDAYLGLADAYVGKGDLEIAKSTLEDAIKFFEENGQDATALKDKLAEVQAEIDRIEAERKAKEEEERLAKLPFVSVQPILDAASDVWGRNWDEWTPEALREKFNIQTFYRSDGTAYESNEDYVNNRNFGDEYYYYSLNEGNGIWVFAEYVDYFFKQGNKYRWHPIKFFLGDIGSGAKTYTCDIVIPESAAKISANTERGDLYDFAAENGINSTDTFISYLGLSVIPEKGKGMEIRTEYGPGYIVWGQEDDSTQNHFIIEIAQKDSNKLQIGIREDYLGTEKGGVTMYIVHQ